MSSFDSCRQLSCTIVLTSNGSFFVPVFPTCLGVFREGLVIEYIELMPFRMLKLPSSFHSQFESTPYLILKQKYFKMGKSLNYTNVEYFNNTISTIVNDHDIY